MYGLVHLTWQCHIDYILKKIRNKPYGLHRLKLLPNFLFSHLLLWIHFGNF